MAGCTISLDAVSLRVMAVMAVMAVIALLYVHETLRCDSVVCEVVPCIIVEKMWWIASFYY